MKSFVEPGNTLTLYETANNGYINISAERNYNLRYELSDHYGNKTTYSFVVKGQKQAIPPVPECVNRMSGLLSNWFTNAEFMLSIPMGNLYTDICYNHRQSASSIYYSAVYQVNNKPVPLHRSAIMWLKMNEKARKDTTGFGIIEINKKGEEEWMGGKYKNGGIEVAINELGGRYAISRDTVAPVISPVAPSDWVKNGRINITLKDEKSGISFHRGEIDGKFALFSNDVKSTTNTYVFDSSRLTKGQLHQLIFRATDGAGNKSEYRIEFDY